MACSGFQEVPKPETEIFESRMCCAQLSSESLKREFLVSPVL